MNNENEAPGVAMEMVESKAQKEVTSTPMDSVRGDSRQEDLPWVEKYRPQRYVLSFQTTSRNMCF